MTQKIPDWQENDKDILAQFPNGPARELLALRQEPDWVLKAEILSIPDEKRAAARPNHWTLGGGLLNRLAGAAVLALLLVVLGFWIFSIASNNEPAASPPQSAVPTATFRPTNGTPTRDLSYFLDTFETATPTEPGGCPVTRLMVDDPPDDPAAAPFGPGNYYINEGRTIWANVDPDGWQPGGEKVLWIKPVGSELTITGRLLDQEYDIPLDVAMPCCYDGGFQFVSLIFFIPGCWEVTAEAGGEQLRFVTEVGGSEGTVLLGLTLLEYKLSSPTPAANKPFTVTLNWQACCPDTEEMLIFLQLIDSNGNIVVQDDEPMLPGVFTTQFITTTHSLEIPEQTGIVTLRLIVAHEETFACNGFWYNDEPVYAGVLMLETLAITAE